MPLVGSLEPVSAAREKLQSADSVLVTLAGARWAC